MSEVEQVEQVNNDQPKKGRGRPVGSYKVICMPFGKYKGKALSEVNSFDPKYLEWLRKQPFFDKFTDLKDWIDKNIQSS